MRQSAAINKINKRLNVKRMPVETAVNRLQRFSWYSLLRSWVNHHARASLFGLGEVVRAPLASIITILVIGIVMAFPASLYVLLHNFTLIGQSWGGSQPTLSVYLRPGMAHTQVLSLMHQLQQRADVSHINYISPEQGLKLFARQTQLEHLRELSPNPLPGLIMVMPTAQVSELSALNALSRQLKSLPGVDLVHIDSAWVQRLHQVILFVQRMIDSIGLLLGLGVVLIIGNTIRLAIQNNRQEILIMQLVGATHAYIRRPFLYRGVLYGVLGGLIAWVIIIILVMLLRQPALGLTAYALADVWSLSHTLIVGLVVLLIGALLGWLGSWLVVTSYLHQEVIS